MASAGQQITQTNIGSGVAYSVSGDTSTGYWSYAFGNSIWWEVETGTASSSYEDDPTVSYAFYRYSISQQQWVLVHSGSQGKSNSTIYRVRNNQMPSSGNIRAEYNGDDSYLFAFKAQCTAGERSRTTERLYVYTVGADSTYAASVRGKPIFGRSLDQAYIFHTGTSYTGLDLNASWLTTTGMAGQKILSSHINRMISVKSARAFI